MADRYLKQVIVMRKDLSMPHGKLATMVAHASMKFIADALSKQRNSNGYVSIHLSPDQLQWLTELDPGIEETGQQSFAKIVVFVNDENELLTVLSKALTKKLTVGTVHDSGYSHNPVGTFVGVAIGPHWPEEFEGVTDDLKVR